MTIFVGLSVVRAVSFLVQQKVILCLGGQRHNLDYETREIFETARSPPLLTLQPFIPNPKWHSALLEGISCPYNKEMAPSLARKVLIIAAADGLVLQPLGQRGQRPISATKITYKDTHISSVVRDGGEGDEAGKSFEVFGIVGKPEESVCCGGALRYAPGLELEQ